MAIINLNQITLSKSGAVLNESIISTHTSEIRNNNLESVNVRAQIGFFKDVDKMFESQTNALDVEGFDGEKYAFIFQYPIADRNVFYFFDVKIKAYLLECFPNWDADKLILTTSAE